MALRPRSRPGSGVPVDGPGAVGAVEAAGLDLDMTDLDSDPALVRGASKSTSEGVPALSRRAESMEHMK